MVKYILKKLKMDPVLYKPIFHHSLAQTAFFWNLVLNILCLGYDEPIAITKQVAPGRATIPPFQVSMGAFVRKAISYHNSHPPGKWFLDRYAITNINWY